MDTRTEMVTPTVEPAGARGPLEPDATASSGAGRLGRTPAVVGESARRAARFEAGMWRSLARWLVRRPHVPPEGTAFAYRGPLVALILVFFMVSLLDVVALDLLVPWPWTWLRFTVLILGVWGTVWMLGMLAAVTVHPHVAGPSGLRVRHGTSLDVHIPWDAVTGARQLFCSRDGRTVQLDGDTLYVLVAKQSTVEITLARPVPVTLPRDHTAEITRLRLHADDAAALVATVRSIRARSNAHR
jgi:hypothetical protein